MQQAVQQQPAVPFAASASCRCDHPGHDACSLNRPQAILTSLNRSDCFRLERQLPGGIRTRWDTAPFHGALKNQGYHLKHNFGHGDRHLSEAFFTLNLLAFFMHQIFELVDGLYQRARTFFSSRRVLGRGAVRLPAVSVYLVGPGAGAHELAAGATAALWVSVVHGPPRWIYASGRPRADNCAP